MTTTEPNERDMAARLPEIRGPLSAAVVDTLAGGRANGFDLDEAAAADPFGEDLHLALHVCYELHYQGFAGVQPAWEWDIRLLELRTVLERVFLDGIRGAVAPGAGDRTWWRPPRPGASACFGAPRPGIRSTSGAIGRTEAF